MRLHAVSWALVPRASGFAALERRHRRGVHSDNVILVGSPTGVCVRHTFVDADQDDCFCRVVEESVAGSGIEAHGAALRAWSTSGQGHVARGTSPEIGKAFEDFA